MQAWRAVMHKKRKYDAALAVLLLIVTAASGVKALEYTPASFAAALQDCGLLTGNAGAWCASLTECTTVLLPGASATLPLNTLLSGPECTGGQGATCCLANPNGGSHASVDAPPSPSVPNIPATSQLDLSRLAPSSLVVPPNGTLTLTGLNITGAQLPTAPFPLPTASFLSLLAIRLSPGARLQLSSVTIVTPACVSLALHQELACRSAPTPNFTVTPTSLVVHSFTTASLSAHDVVLTCSGRQLPAPCTAVVVRSGAELVHTVTSWEARNQLAAEGGPSAGPAYRVPLYMYLQSSISLGDPVNQLRNALSSSSSSSDNNASSNSPGNNNRADPNSEASDPSSTMYFYMKVAVFRITQSKFVLAGPPDRSSVLDLASSSSLFGLLDDGAVQVQHLTLRGLPLGPPNMLPEALMRLPLWTWAFYRDNLGAAALTRLNVSDVTVELPPDELAMWRVEAGLPMSSPSAAAAGNVSGGGAVAGASQLPCVLEDGEFWTTSKFSEVPGCSNCLLASSLATRSRLAVLENVLLVEEGQQQQLLQQQGQPVNSASARPPPEDSTTPGWLSETRRTQEQVPALCNLTPGPGALEADQLAGLINNYTVGMLPPPGPVPLMPAFALPTVRHFVQAGTYEIVSPLQLSYSFQPNAELKYGTVLVRDAMLRTDDEYAFTQVQAVIGLPGYLLLGDPVRVRTLDLVGLPSTLLLEREPPGRIYGPYGREETAVLLPFLDDVREQRRAAGQRGLLSEPVSLTVRHVVLINLPAAGPFVRFGDQPPSVARAPSGPGGGPAGAGRRALQEAIVAADAGHWRAELGSNHDVFGGDGDRRGSSARVLQQAQPDGEQLGVPENRSAADYLGGMPPSLANFTSCVWSLQLDRAAVGQAVRGRMQLGTQGAGALTATGGSSSGNSSNYRMQSPVDVSYVLLESVQLMVPERELLLLAWTWATNATRHAADPGLAEQLQLMLDGSRLAGGAAALQQLQQLRVSLGSPGAAPALPAGLRLVYEQLVWCGLLGSNVTLTSQLPAPTELSYQPLDLELPVAYGSTSTDPAGPSQAPGTMPSPSAPHMDERSSPNPGGQLGGSGGSSPTAHGPGHNASAGGGDPKATPGAAGALGPLVEASSSSGSGSGSLPVGLTAGLVAGLGLVLLLSAAVAVPLLLRRRRARAQHADKLAGLWQEASASCKPSMTHCKGGGGKSGADLGIGDAAANTGAGVPLATESIVLGALGSDHESSGEAKGSGTENPAASGSLRPGCGPSQPSLPPDVRAVVQQATVGLRLHLEQQRHGMQQQPLAPQSHALAGPAGAAPPALAVTGAGSGAASSTLGKVSASDAGSGFLASLPSTSVAGSSVRGSALSSLGKSLPHDSGGDGGGGGGSCGGALVLQRELGRGAQGVVFAGRWRGLDVAVKSVLMQRLVGPRAEQQEQQPAGPVGSWHGPSLSTALAEGSISSAMSHPHVVATYATYVHGPEEEQQQGQQQPARAAATAVAGASTPLVGRKGSRVSRLGPTQRRLSSGMVVQDMHGAGGAEGGGASHEAAAARRDPMGHLGVGQVVEERDEELGGGEEEGGQEAERDGRDRRHSVSGTPGEAAQLRQAASLLPEPPPNAGCSQSTAPGQTQVEVWKLTLVQELCNGGSLRDSLLAGRLARRGCGPWPRALRPGVAVRLALHVARGSAHLHRHGVLWNDLTAANVLLHFGSAAQQWHQQQQEQQQRQEQDPQHAPAPGQNDGAHGTCGTDAASLDFVAKVADFGLSRRLPEDATHASGLEGRSGLYVAPEVVRYGRCTPASDVYAYGVLLWEVAAGVPLPELLLEPEGGAVRSWLAQQAFVPPEEAAALPAELLPWPGAGQLGSGGRGPEGAAEDTCLPAAYAALAEQCLQADPGARPNFEDVCGRLEEMAAGWRGQGFWVQQTTPGHWWAAASNAS